jgi:tetratricopeptide (TPR) repeat protein
VALKDSLRLLIEAAREKESEELVSHINDAPSAEPRRWEAKDTLAHLSSWRSLAAAELNAVRLGTPGGITTDDTDAINARVYAATHDLRAAEVLEAGDQSWDSLAAALEACTDAELTRPRFRRPEQRIWTVVPGNTYFHLAEHLGYWYEEQGHVAAAEQAAIWAHDLEVRAFPGNDRRQGMAAYNLSCFYARRGRAAEALPLLRQGLALAPDMRDWAKQDSDLDPIRTVPDIEALLA